MASSDDKGQNAPVDAGSSSGILLNQPIVIDNGTATVKAGFAGGSKPKVTVGNKVGRPKHMRIMPGGALEREGSSSLFVGKKVDDHRGAFLLDWPMEKGSVVDGKWDAMEAVWEHVYSKENLNAKVDEHPVLMTETPLNPRRHREKASEIFFETFRAPALFFSPQAVLSLYASGRTTGVTIDVGEGSTHVVPVYEGFALRHSVVRSDLAGRDVTERYRQLLRRSGLCFRTSSEFDLVKTMKEETCYVAFNAGKEETGTSGGSVTDPRTNTTNTPSAEYQLPDGRAVELGNERFRAPEILFRPDLVGSEELSVADALVKAVSSSDLDLRPVLFNSVVLAGGSTKFPGFGDRFLHEIRQRAPERTRIRVSAPPDRVNSAWSGGSILASLSTFKNMWVSKGDYDEYGSNIVHRDSL